MRCDSSYNRWAVCVAGWVCHVVAYPVYVLDSTDRRTMNTEDYITTVTTVVCLMLTLLFTPSYAMNGKCDSLRRPGLGVCIAETTV